MSIENAVVGLIGSLGTAAGSRVYRELVQQAPTLPVVVVTRQGGSLIRTMGGPSLQRSTLRIEVLAADLATATTVSDALIAALDGYQGTTGGVDILASQLRTRTEGSLEDGDKVFRILQHDFEFLSR